MDTQIIAPVTIGDSTNNKRSRIINMIKLQTVVSPKPDKQHEDSLVTKKIVDTMQ